MNNFPTTVAILACCFLGEIACKKTDEDMNLICKFGSCLTQEELDEHLKYPDAQQYLLHLPYVGSFFSSEPDTEEYITMINILSEKAKAMSESYPPPTEEVKDFADAAAHIYEALPMYGRVDSSAIEEPSQRLSERVCNLNKLSYHDAQVRNIEIRKYEKVLKTMGKHCIAEEAN